MGSLLPSQISSPEEIVGNEKEPIMPTVGKQEGDGSHGDGVHGVRASSNGQRGAFLPSPLSWLKVLSMETHWSFVFGVIVVYGLSQGFGGGANKVAVDFYWKDVQLVQPSAAQVYQGIISTPWIVKPLWGLLTDVLPVAGYRRKPYFIFAGLLGLVSMLSLSLHSKLHIVFALVALTAGSAGVAIADVTIDACVAQNSIACPSLAANMQSLCGLSSSIGALMGFSISGVLVHAMGSQEVLGLLSIPFLLVLSVGVLIKESRATNFAYKEVHQKFLVAAQTMWSSLKCPEIWKPCLYMYFSISLALDIQKGIFYWYTDPKAGPSFSQETVGYIFSIGSVGSLLGVLLYQNLLQDFPFRSLFFWAQLLTALAGMLDLILVLRLNLKLGMPDYMFVVVDECVSQMTARIMWLPLLVLSSKLCPSGIEGTFFALLMSIDNLGLLSASWGGGLLLHILSVTRTEFGNLWMAILIRNFMRLLPLVLLFLVPGSDRNSKILPADEELVESGGVENLKEADVEMASLVNNIPS